MFQTQSSNPHRSLQRHFERIGARLRVETVDASSRWLRANDSYRLDLIENRRQGQETFHLVLPAWRRVQPLVLDVVPSERALLLMLRIPADDNPSAPRRQLKHRYLCGHDERAWFIAAIARQSGVVNVDKARDALKPPQVLAAQYRGSTKRKDWHRRRNSGFLRQGEWFFLPAPGAIASDAVIHRNEPISRGAGKPHRVEELTRLGGVDVHVCQQYPSGVTTPRYRELIRQDPRLKKLRWRKMTRDASVYGRGRVTHSDHATVYLPDWHRIHSNTESEASFVSNLAFLD